jgi:hypothetical protein
MRFKNELYDDEQSKIKKDLIDILELNNKNGFILYHIDNDDELKSKILGLLPKIRIFYSMSKITAISTPEKIKRPYISIYIKEYLIENHLICIRYADALADADALCEKYIKIYKSFGDERTLEFIKLYFGNNAINTTELLNILPIYL